MYIVSQITGLKNSAHNVITKTNVNRTDKNIIASEKENPGLIYYFTKKIDRIVTFIILILLKMIPVWKIRGIILLPFIECDSVPAIGYNVYFTELLTRKYVFGKNISISSSCLF